MTIGDQIKLGEKLGHKPTQQEIRDEETRRLMEIKDFVNNYGHSDVHPFEVIRTISPICVEIRAMRTVQTKFPKDFHAGGFVGHYADNRQGQEYDYFPEPKNPIERIRWSKANANGNKENT